MVAVTPSLCPTSVWHTQGRVRNKRRQKPGGGVEGASLGSGGAGFAGRLCRSEKMPADDTAGLAGDVTNRRPPQGPAHAAPGRLGLCPGTAVPRGPGLLPRASLTVLPASRSLSSPFRTRMASHSGVEGAGASSSPQRTKRFPSRSLGQSVVTWVPNGRGADQGVAFLNIVALS